LQATTMAAIDAAARLDRDWLSRCMSDPASLRAHARRYRELKGRRSPERCPAKTHCHGLVRVISRLTTDPPKRPLHPRKRKPLRTQVASVRCQQPTFGGGA
jgi:hypothetical protein